MAYTTTIPRWDNTGAEPPEQKKTDGWEVGDKPPADWFNWFFNGLSTSVAEDRFNSEVEDVDDLKRYQTKFKVENGRFIIVAEEVI